MVLAAITTYKRAPAMVERALRSVIAQTYTDWECVVVDDSPSDYELRGEVRKMVKGYAAVDSRIRYVPHEHNRGVSAARNTALEIAGGGGGHEFIAYLDDDDEWLPEKLEKQLAKFKECSEDTGLVYCNSYIIDEDTGNKRLMRHTSKKYEGNVYTNLLRKNFVDIMAMIRSKYLAEAGGFDETMPAFEDWEAWLRLAKICRFAFVDEVLDNVYQGGGRAHVNVGKFRVLAAHEIITERHRSYLTQDPYTYWFRLRRTIKEYPACGQYRKFFSEWLKLVSLQPLRVFWNILILPAAWIYFPLKYALNKKCSKLFYKLKWLKQKLKGECIN